MTGPPIHFVWKAKDRFGRPVVREVPAYSAQESKEILLAEGCTDPVLVRDEVGATVASARAKRTMFGEEIKVTAEAAIKYRNKPQATFFRVVWEGLWRSKRIVLMILVATAYVLYTEVYYALVFPIIGLLAWILFLVVNGLPSIYYGRLHRAADWHRWSEVVELVSTLRRVNRFRPMMVRETSLILFRAQALAGTGKLAEALAEYSKCENQPGCPSWMYKAFVAGIYDKAKQHDTALEWNLRAVQEKPISSTYLDLANRYLRYKGDSARGRAALAEAEKTPMTENGIPHYKRCLGLVAYLESGWPAARHHLEESLEMMESTPNVPFRAGSISITKAYLCCVLARQGDHATARKNLAEARAYLVATREDELLAECEKLAGAQF